MLKPCRSLKIRNECFITDNSKLSMTDLLRMFLDGETGNDKVGMVKGEWYMENGKYPISFSHSPFDVFITSDLLPIEGQRNPFNALLMNFKLFKTGCFIRLYKSH